MFNGYRNKISNNSVYITNRICVHAREETTTCVLEIRVSIQVVRSHNKRVGELGLPLPNGHDSYAYDGIGNKY